MIMKLFCFHDTVSMSFGPPMAAVNLNSFIRDTCQPQLERADSGIGKNPQDFAVFSIAEYDSDTGIVKPFSPTQHGLLSDFKKA